VRAVRHVTSFWWVGSEESCPRLSYHSLSEQGLIPIELINTTYIQVMLVVKTKFAKASNRGSIPGSGRSPREGNGNPLQYSCLENHMDRGAWRATPHAVAKSLT